MSTIATDTILTQDIINKYTWPVTIDAGVKVTLGDTLSISTNQGTNGYFKIGGDNVQILGNNKTVTITNIPNYPGLFQNGTNTESGSPLIIQDLGILSTGTTTLAVDGGWLGQSYFGKDLSADSINVTDCYSTGDITGGSSGGIFGVFSSGTATNCYSTGGIFGGGAGGIFGDGAGGTATNCYIANGSWSDSVASTSLTDIDNVWLDYDSNLTNIPWLLKSFNTVVTPPPPFLRIVSIKVIGTYKSLI
jgi:hypothetical protein